MQAIPRPRQGVALIARLISATPCGSPVCGYLFGDPQGVEGVGKGLCTSVTASRMTDAYGASTLRVPHDRAPWVYDYPNAQMRHPDLPYLIPVIGLSNIGFSEVYYRV